MKLLKSNYDNKAVINHLKSSFSILETTNDISFTDNSFLETDLTVIYKNGIYTLLLTLKGLNVDSLVIEESEYQSFEFSNRTDAIKKILKTLKIIN
jgi:hypothetical protein